MGEVSSDSPKKDFTSLADYSKMHADEIPAPVEGQVMSEQHIEQIQNFESLDDYAKSHPAAEAPPETAPEPSAPAASDDFPVTQDAGAGESSLQLSGISESPMAPAPPSEASPTSDFAELSAQLPSPEAAAELSAQLPMPASELSAQLPAPAQASELAEPPPSAPSQSFAELSAELPTPPPQPVTPAGVYVAPERSGQAASAPRESLTAAFSSTQPAAAAPKRGAQHTAPVAPPVPAAFPFSVLIRGQLKPDEQNKLIELLEKENFGITGKDLETQLRGDRILLPRISEYAAVLVIQALRSADVVIQAAPSDEIFATDDTRDQLDDPLLAPPAQPQASTFDAEHPSEEIPITTEPFVPGQEIADAIDVVTASLGIKSMSVELRRSAEFNDALEALKRELKRKAHHRGAHAIIGFKLQIDRLDLPSHYRVSVLGTAVRNKSLK
jgi:uncharacterized protein YbjQ (UPF0145 family)